MHRRTLVILAAALAGCGGGWPLELVDGAETVEEDPVPPEPDDRCSSLPMPAADRCEVVDSHPRVARACLVGPGGQVVPAERRQLAIVPDGCVGAMLVFHEGWVPEPSPGAGGAAAGPYRFERRPCCVEEDPDNQVGHVITATPATRRLLIRTRAPVRGPTQVYFRLSMANLFPGRARGNDGYTFRFYVGGQP